MSSLNRVVGWTEILLWNGLLNWMVRQSDQPSRDSRSCILKGHIWWTLYLDGSISKLVKEISCLSSKAEIQGLVQEFLFISAQLCACWCHLLKHSRKEKEAACKWGGLFLFCAFFLGRWGGMLVIMGSISSWPWRELLLEDLSSTIIEVGAWRP